MDQRDVRELRWWFAEPAPESFVGRLAAQTYEPRPSGAYDHSTDYRLEHMMQRAKNRAGSEWTRIHGILARVAAEPGGEDLVAILRCAFGSSALLGGVLEHGELALSAPTLRARAEAAATESERERLVGVALRDALRDRASPMTAAVRAVEADAHLERHGVVITRDAFVAAAEEAVRSAAAPKTRDDGFLSAIRAETQELVDRAGEAYRRARTEIGATKRAAKAARARASEALLEELLGAKAAKSAARFEARLRRSA